MSAPRLLSPEREHVLLDKINRYATEGTLLTASQVRDFAQAVYGEPVGINWVGRFLNRHKDVIHDFFRLSRRCTAQSRYV